jgi:hypothetical protein
MLHSDSPVIFELLQLKTSRRIGRIFVTNGRIAARPLAHRIEWTVGLLVMLRAVFILFAFARRQVRDQQRLRYQRDIVGGRIFASFGAQDRKPESAMPDRQASPSQRICRKVRRPFTPQPFVLCRSINHTPSGFTTMRDL